MPSVYLDDEEEQQRRDIISTGHPEIDKKLGGGIPVGSLTLIEGQSAAGKSVLCQQMIWGSLKNGYKTLLFTTENSVRSLISQMDSLGLFILDEVLLGWLKIYYLPPSVVRQQVRETFNTILEVMAEHEDYHLAVLDAMTPMVSLARGEEALAYLERCKALCDGGRSIINVTHSYAFEPDFLVRIRSMCDAHFMLFTEKMGDKLVKTLEVSKIRGAAQTTGNILTFDVEPEIGMKIMPVSRAKA